MTNQRPDWRIKNRTEWHNPDDYWTAPYVSTDEPNPVIETKDGEPIELNFDAPDPHRWSDEKPDDRRRNPAPNPHRVRNTAARWSTIARCAECGVITWTGSYSGGRKRTDKPHRDGCSKPPGRFDR